MCTCTIRCFDWLRLPERGKWLICIRRGNIYPLLALQVIEQNVEIGLSYMLAIGNLKGLKTHKDRIQQFHLKKLVSTVKISLIFGLNDT